MKFGGKHFQTKLLSHLSHKVCCRPSSPFLLHKFTNINVIVTYIKIKIDMYILYLTIIGINFFLFENSVAVESKVFRPTAKENTVHHGGVKCYSRKTW